MKRSKLLAAFAATFAFSAFADHQETKATGTTTPAATTAKEAAKDAKTTATTAADATKSAAKDGMKDAKAAMPTDAKMTAEQEKMMKAWEAAGKLGENHKNLGYLAGEWNITTRFWQGPGAPAQESTGKSRFEPVLGGRFMHETVEGNMMGKPFQGTSYIGYDNTKKKYVTTWMDNMSTGVFKFEGESKDSGKTITSTSEFMCPMTGQPKSVRQVMKKMGKNKVMVEHFEKDAATGKDFKAMEVVYTRG